jgi:radical SAM protein (TIGR01212 family)
LAEQARRARAFLERRYEARLFFAYFQAFSSTWASLDRLRAVYDEGLEACGPGLRGLVVSTRPDCVDRGVAELLASYAARGLEVWVELGLQSSNDRTLERIGRGHDAAAFIRARELLRGSGLRVAVHLVHGLPGEGSREALESVRFVAGLGVEGVKFHDLHVPAGSRLAGEFLAGEIALPAPAAHLSWLADAVELLPPETEVIRLASDAQAEQRLAPRRPADKSGLYRELEAELLRRNSAQARQFLHSCGQGSGLGIY